MLLHSNSEDELQEIFSIKAENCTCYQITLFMNLTTYVVSPEKQHIVADTEDIIVGLGLMFSATFILLLNQFIIHAIRRDRELCHLSSYKFLMWMAWSDTTQSAVHFMTGVFTVFPGIWNPWIAKALGVFPCYIFYDCVTVILAVNRFTAIITPHTDARLFSKRTLNTWLLVCCLTSSFWSLCDASPWSTMRYYPNKWSWWRDPGLPLSDFVALFGMVFELVVMAISGICHIPIFFVIYYKRKVGTLGRRNAIRDLRILVQAFTIMLYSLSSNLFWYEYSVFLPETKYVYMALNFMNVYNSAVNPVMYIIMNGSLRKKVGTVINQTKSGLSNMSNSSFIQRSFARQAVSEEVLFKMTVQARHVAAAARRNVVSSGT
ncbi:serpentine type 7TM GPCR chemoreceptor srt domain-containing protein [Ditylenchus destructor]|uniref:Serpentine type 7TM GPCR chemoreceptor srt domain-containing protein n=1 Tax=Ditylenchus destructor TaxID=166010 RepID=A0AAD4QZD3_9BILA|nr:serpentine type 7TM GPCR chemoreceptor srt domain-containing protein [Ditylenchus destructor]